MGVPTTSDGRAIAPVQITDSTGGQGSTRISAGPPSTGQTAKTLAGSTSINTGATITWETVTAGKTLYITDVHISTDSAAATDVQIKSGGTIIFESFVKDTSPVSVPGLETQPTAASGTIVTVVAGTQTGKTINYYIAGYEQ